ncbi:MAG TPA: DNA repair protein RadC [Candidatus Paceibacterota bacterium]
MTTATYTIRNNDLVLDNHFGQYVLKVRDLPAEMRPRERLLQQGPGALSVQELLAIIFVTGTRSEEVLTMTNRIMTEYGERNVLNAPDPRVLSEQLAIPEGKAMQIVAVGELGRRFFKGTKNGAPVIRTASDVYNHVFDMRQLPKEHLRGIYLNSHYQLVHDETISIGTVDSNLIHPREVFRPAITYGAVGVILVHNHPSGNTEPSLADHSVTGQLIEAGKLLGIDLVDHVIVTSDAFASVLSSHGEG